MLLSERNQSGKVTYSFNDPNGVTFWKKPNQGNSTKISGSCRGSAIWRIVRAQGSENTLYNVTVVGTCICPFLQDVKEESEKSGLKLNSQKTKIMESVPPLHGKQMGKQWKH